MRNVLSIAAILTSAVAIFRPAPPPQLNRADVIEFLSGITMVDISVDYEGHTIRAARYTGNFQIVNGLGVTPSTNGLGNLFVGYGEVNSDDVENRRTGSHNIVGGIYARYTSWGGILGGSGNWTSGPHASVTGGKDNQANGGGSSVSGGVDNHANGPYSWVGGGWVNTAASSTASVSGGYHNEASGEDASVCGGAMRTATGTHDWAGGGLYQDR